MKAKGLKLMVDFHYSDTWADPGKQYKPAAWARPRNRPAADRRLQLHVRRLHQPQGAGHHTGQRADRQRDPHRDAVGGGPGQQRQLRQPRSAAQGRLQRDQGVQQPPPRWSSTPRNVASDARGFYDGIRAQGVQWDMTALSYYCYWHGSMSGMAGVVSDMKSRYGKPVILAETAYPFTTANYDHAGNIITSSQPCCRLPGHAGRAAGQLRRRTEHLPQRRRERRLLVGTHLARRRTRQRLGSRATSTTPATNGRTRPSSTGPAGSTPTSAGCRNASYSVGSSLRPKEPSMTMHRRTFLKVGAGAGLTVLGAQQALAAVGPLLARRRPPRSRSAYAATTGPAAAARAPRTSTTRPPARPAGTR